MPTLQIHTRHQGGSYSLHALHYRRALYRGLSWLALELPSGDVLLCRHGGAPPRARLSGDAAVRFRHQLYNARHLDGTTPVRGRRRVEDLCARLASVAPAAVLRSEEA